MSRAARVSLAIGAIVITSATCTLCLVPIAWLEMHPCWRYSGAAWCGHFCDDDPCACPHRSATRDTYGGGVGCVAP